MRHTSLKRIAIVLLLVLVASTSKAATKEYLTDEEIDFIRDAQGLSHRIPALLQLACPHFRNTPLRRKHNPVEPLPRAGQEIVHHRAG